MSLAAEGCVVVNGFGIGVEQRCGKAGAQPAPQLQLAGLPCGVSAGGFVDESRGAARARTCSAEGITIWQELLHAMRAFHAEIGCRHLQCPGQIALDGYLPGLRITDADVGVDCEGVSRGSAALRESAGASEWTGRAGLIFPALRERRLLRELKHGREVYRGIVIGPVACTDDDCRCGDGAPRKANARFDANAVRTDKRVRIGLAG